MIIAFHKLLLAEEVQKLTLLVGFLHGALQLVIAHHLIAIDVNLVDFYLVILVDIYIHYHLVGV